MTPYRRASIPGCDTEQREDRSIPATGRRGPPGTRQPPTPSDISAAGPVSERTFRRVAKGVALLLVVLIAPLLMLSGRALVIAEGIALVASSTIATAMGTVSVVRTRGIQRRWRLLLTVCLLSLLVASVHWCLLFAQGERVELRPSGSDTAYLLAPVLSLLALMILPKGPPATVPGKRAPPDMDGTTQSSPIVVVLDSLVFVVSMFLIAWMALLRRIADSGISGLPLAIALGFPLCGTLVVVTIPLIMVFRRPQNGRAVAVLTAGLLVLAGSASVIVHLTVSGALSADRLALYWLGMVAAPPLIAAAMLVPQQRVKHRRERPGADDLAVWLHAYLPYLPSLIAAVLVVVPAARRDDLDGTTVLLAITLAALVVIRQMITVGQNARLLVKVRAAHRRLHYQALHDPLTGLANRALFTTELTEAVEEHHSHQLSVVTLFCDLDEFKAVNDALGHAAGDELLRAVAMRLRTAVRDDDLVARIGGDEFAVLIRDARRNARAIGEDTAGRIAGAMRPAFSLHGVPRHVRASVGVAVADSSVSGVTAEELMHRADMAMYEAKCHEQQTRAAHRLPSPFSWLQRWRQSVETSRPPGQKLQHDPDGRDVTARRR